MLLQGKQKSYKDNEKKRRTLDSDEHRVSLWGSLQKEMFWWNTALSGFIWQQCAQLSTQHVKSIRLRIVSWCMGVFGYGLWAVIHSFETQTCPVTGNTRLHKSSVEKLNKKTVKPKKKSQLKGNWKNMHKYYLSRREFVQKTKELRVKISFNISFAYQKSSYRKGEINPTSSEAAPRGNQHWLSLVEEFTRTHMSWSSALLKPCSISNVCVYYLLFTLNFITLTKVLRFRISVR